MSQLAAVIDHEFERVVGGEHGGTVFAPSEEQCSEDPSGAGSSDDVEEISNFGVRVAGFTPENGLEMEQSFGGEEGMGGGGGINAENSNFGGGG